MTPGRSPPERVSGLPGDSALFRPSDHDAELSEEEFRLLREFIHERFGLFFEENQRGSLRARLAGRLRAWDLSPSRTTTATSGSGPSAPRRKRG